MYLYDSIITETRVYFDPYNQTRKDPLRLAPPAAAAPIRGFGTAWDKKSEQAYHVACSDVVEVTGFEPAAFWSRTKRATKLRYASNGANVGIRTPDLRITSAPLYLLSHIGTADSS